MTQEQIESLIATSAPLVENPTSWNNLSEEAKQVFLLLMPNPYFTETQSQFIKLWWFFLDQEMLIEINQNCPANTVLEGKLDINENLYISCDVLSDALNEGRLKEILPILKDLPLTYVLEDKWPLAL